MAVMVLGPLEMLNRTLQSKTETVAGMVECVNLVVTELLQLRCDNKFDELVSKCTVYAELLGLKPLKVPRVHKPPGRFTGTAETHSAVSVSDHYRPQYFELIDTATSELAKRFTDSVGLQTYSKLEGILITGKVYEALLQPYIEIYGTDLALELAMFRRSYVINNVSSAADILRNMSTDMRSMFSEVEKLVRLLMVCPCSSAAAERSFSALRRLNHGYDRLCHRVD